MAVFPQSQYQRFGKYILLDRINVGGMAEVFRGKQTGVEGFSKLVALKRILPNISADPEFIEMFVDEAKLTVQMQHANVVQIYDLGNEEGCYYIAMEYISGVDLRTVWDRARKRNRLLPIAMSCHIVQKMCEGLDYAHRKRDDFGHELGIVHRDVSPQNALIAFEGEVKVVDFGIAKATKKVSKTQAGVLKGKFGYMSPEQVRGIDLDNRSDVFACGVVLYELLVGERLFLGESDFSTLEKVRNVEMVPPTQLNPNLSPQVERIVLKALAKNRDDRYRWCSEMAEDLQRFLFASNQPFARTDLQRYMKQHFEEEIAKEYARLEKYRNVSDKDLGQSGDGGGGGGGFWNQPQVQPQQPPPPPPPPPQQQQQQQQMMGQPGMGGMPAHGGYNQQGQSFVGQMPGPPGMQGMQGGMQGMQGGMQGMQGGMQGMQGGMQGMQGMQGGMQGYGMPGMNGTGGQTHVTHPGMTQPHPAAGGTKIPKWAIGLIAALVLVVLIGGGVAAAMVFGKPKTGTLTVDVNPPIAEIKLDGELLSNKSPATAAELKADKYILEVSKKGYKTVVRPVIIVGGRAILESIVLEPENDGGNINVNSTPPGLNVHLDGRDTGKVTPATLNAVAAGSHTIKLYQGATPIYTYPPVTVENGGQHEAKIDLSTIPPSLDVKSTPPGAKVLVDGREMGTTPLNTDRGLTPGSVKVRVEMVDCQPFEQQVELKNGIPTPVNATLTCRGGAAAAAPAPANDAKGKLTVSATMVSDVFLDGTKLGRTPILSYTVPAGSHELKLVPAAGDKPPHTETIDVVAGQMKVVNHAY